MKKSTLKPRVPLIAVAVVMMMALMLTAAAAGVVHLFRNDVIVSSVDDIPTESQGGSGPAVGYSVTSPNGTPPSTLEEMTEGRRFKSNDWPFGEHIAGGITWTYAEWDSAEVLSNDPNLRIRRVSRADGAEKMEYTAENPANLLDALTGRVTLDLSWMDEHYDYVPDANLAFVVTDPYGNYVDELFETLYAKEDGSGYISLDIYNMAQKDCFGQSYIIEGSYETAYYYTSQDGYEFLIKMNTGNIWAECCTSHTYINLYGAYLSSDEVEDILDNLSLSVDG